MPLPLIEFTFNEQEMKDAFNVLLESIHERPDVFEGFNWETCSMKILNASEKNQATNLANLFKIGEYLKIDTD